jgi:hypothetical protein
LHHLGAGEHADEAAHADKDVNLIADALVKKSDGGFDLLLVLAALVLFLRFLPLAVRLLPQADLLLPINPHRSHLRPLLRGPPR